MSAGDETGGETGRSGVDPVTPPTIPEHSLLRRIGRGSYGEIWLARSALGAYRAVKLIYRAALQDHAGAYEREFAGTARFEPISRQHEGLVQVLQFGRGTNGAGKFFYYVMELADNVSHTSRPTPQPGDPAFPADYVPRTLAREIITRSPLPFEEVLELGERLGEALHFLHSQSLVHRDIKPSNIIFVGGVPKLADIGCVADLDNSLSAAGTMGYMPSEGPSTISADLFSVGKVLYEAATGKDRQDFPDLPTNLIAASDQRLLELNEIWLKACANNPAERYQSAAQLQNDLSQLQQGKSLRTVRMRRRQLALASGALALVLAAGAVAVLAWTIKHANATPTPRVIVTDDFDEPRLNTNLWSWSTKKWPELGKTGHRQFSVAQTNGELTIATYAQHDRGYSTFGAAWVDTEVDFRQCGDCRVEIELTGTNQQGLLRLIVSDGATPAEDGSQTLDEQAVRLLSSGPRSWVNDTVAIEFLPEQQAAVLYPDSRIWEQFEIIDLARLSRWRLRFYTEANSSAAFGNGMAVFRLRRISAAEKSGPRTVIGHVVNELTGLSVADAIIKDQYGMRIAKTLASGAFKLTPDLWPVRLRVEHDDFLPSDEKVISEDISRRGPTTVELRKQTYTVGDAVDVFLYGNLDLRNIGFLDGKLCALASKVKGNTTDCLLVPVDFDAKQILPETMHFQTGEHPFGSFAQCGKRIVATSAWPGRIHTLTPDGYSTLFEPKLPLGGTNMNWPWTATFDGTNLWVLEKDGPENRFGLNQLDLESGKTLRHLRSVDQDLAGLAWDGEARRFWVSSLNGSFYAVDPDDAIRGGTMDSGKGRSFPGYYTALAFGNGHLWGLDREKRQIYKIKIKD